LNVTLADLRRNIALGRADRAGSGAKRRIHPADPIGASGDGDDDCCGRKVTTLLVFDGGHDGFPVF